MQKPARMKSPSRGSEIPGADIPDGWTLPLNRPENRGERRPGPRTHFKLPCKQWESGSYRVPASFKNFQNNDLEMVRGAVESESVSPSKIPY